MKLYNQTAVPDDIIRAVIKSAAQMLKPRVRHGKVIVKVTRAQVHVSGYAVQANRVLPSEVCGKIYTKLGNDINEGRKMIQTDCGWMLGRLPMPAQPVVWASQPHREPLAIAEKFFWMIIHEWGHIADFQHNVKCRLGERKRFTQYNRQWKNRPHERRANAYRDEAKERGLTPEAEEAILNLAVWMEHEVSDG